MHASDGYSYHNLLCSPPLAIASYTPTVLEAGVASGELIRAHLQYSKPMPSMMCNLLRVMQVPIAGFR